MLCFKNHAERLVGAKGRYEHLVLTVLSFGLGAAKKTWAFELKWNEGYLDWSALHNKGQLSVGPYAFIYSGPCWLCGMAALSKGQCSNPLLALVSKLGRARGPSRLTADSDDSLSQLLCLGWG